MNQLSPVLTFDEGDSPPDEDHQALIWIAARRELRACNRFFSVSTIPSEVVRMSCPTLLAPGRRLSGIWFLYMVPVCLRDACIILERLQDGECPADIEYEFYWF